MPDKKRFVVAPLDGPFRPTDPTYATTEEAQADDATSFYGDVTLGCWDRMQGSRLVSIRWQGTWYQVA